MLLHRVVVGGEDEDAGPRRGADDVVDDPRPLEQFFVGVPVRGLLDRRPWLDRRPVHPPLGDPHARGIGDDRLLERDLRPVGERGHHVRLLPPAACELGLGRRVAVRVLEALDVSAEHGPHAQPAHEAIEIHGHAGLVPVRVRKDDPRPVGVRLEDRPDRAVELGVHEDDVLAALDRGERDVGAVLDGPRDFHDRLDRLRRAENRRIVGDRRAATRHCVVELGRRANLLDGRRPGLHVGLPGSVEPPVRDGDELHPRDGSRDLERDPATHEAGPDHPDPDRPTLPLSDLERAVDDDHRGSAAGSARMRTSKSGQLRSLSETILGFASGQSIANTGSSQRRPRSASGV